MKDYRISVKVRNNRLLKAIEEAGGKPGNKWCDKNGLTYKMVNDLINMTISPLLETGELSKTASMLCDVLGKIPDELWSAEQLRPLEKNFSELEMDYQQVVAMLPSDEQSYLPDFYKLENEQTRSLIESALATLTVKERAVMRLRFEDDLTLEECGEMLGVTRERVRQIEIKALRKLRHPARIGMYVDALDGIDDKARAEYKAATKKFQEGCAT